MNLEDTPSYRIRDARTRVPGMPDLYCSSIFPEALTPTARRPSYTHLPCACSTCSLLKLAALTLIKSLSFTGPYTEGLVCIPTSSSKNFLQSRFARSLRGSLRSSAPQPSAAFAWIPRKQSLSKDFLAENDWINITHTDLPLQLDCSEPLPSHPGTDALLIASECYVCLIAPPTASFRPLSSASSNLVLSPATASNSCSTNSHSSPTHSTHLTRHTLSSRPPHFEPKGDSDQVCPSPLGLSDLTLDFPQPPTYIPAPFSDTSQSVQGDKPDIHQENDSVLSNLHLRTTHKEISESTKESPPLHRSVDQPSSAVEPVRVFDRLKSLTKAFSVYSNVTSAIGKPPSFLAKFTRAKHLRKPTSNGKTVALPKPPSRVDVTPPPVVEQTSFRIKYERVDPSQLTASSSLLNLDILGSSARTSFVPPSPSWLSRNVPSFDPSKLSDYLRTSPQLNEDSAKPSAPPRLFISHSRPHSLHLSPLEDSDFPNYPYQVCFQFSQ